MATKEAAAHIKINKRLEEAGWRFFASAEGKANVVLEPNGKLTTTQVSALGDDFKRVKNCFVDSLLLDEKGAPLVVLEAKAENKNPLVGALVADIEAEQHLVAANRELIARLEQRVQAAIGRVWGAAVPAEVLKTA